MKKRINIIIVLAVCFTTNCFSQLPLKQDADYDADTTTVNQLLQTSKEKLSTSPDSTVIIATRALEIADKIEYEKGQALALKNIGNGNYYLGNLVDAVEYWNRSLTLYEKFKDEIGISNILNNIASVYSDQGDDVKALEYALRSLTLAEKLGDTLRLYSALNTVANIYYSKVQTKDKALDYLLKALPLAQALGMDQFGIISENIGQIYYEKDNCVKALEYYRKAVAALNDNQDAPFAYSGIGKVYLAEGNIDEALKYHGRALALAEKLDIPLRILEALQGIASVYLKKSDTKTAISYFKRAEDLANQLKSNPSLKDVYEEIAKAYNKAGDYKNAFLYQSKLTNVKDTLFNEITERKLVAVRLESDLRQKKDQITLLAKDKDLQTASIKRQKLAKNAFMVGLFLAFIIALLIYRSYRIKAKTHKILDQQKNEIEHLLLNILPEEVAQELKVTGHATPRHYESVSVMFTDFKGFTTIADQMDPNELVKELDDCFIAFDAIIEKYQLEKIKTIGDAYMCAGGIPTADEQHVLKIVKAGLDIQQYIAVYNQNRIDKGQEPWKIRIGIHVGPVVAGVVGKKKYAYDIWGGTVNIASRMESNGEPGKVNISSATYEIIKDYYECTYRGKISAKNIGEIDMYFIEHEHTIPLTLKIKDSVINQ